MCTFYDENVDIVYSPSKSNKVHAIVTHVPEFIRMTGEPLGRYSEQAMESVHQDWEKTWENYKCGVIASPVSTWMGDSAWEH